MSRPTAGAASGEPVGPPSAGRWLRRWWGFPAAALALAGLMTYALVSRPASSTEAPPPTETVTYEVTGPSEASVIQYGDVYSQAFSPYVSTQLVRIPLPWRLTVPQRGPISIHDLAAFSDPPSPITCTVRQGAVVVTTHTARGVVGCDSQPR